jgi:hypothetical protein
MLALAANEERHPAIGSVALLPVQSSAPWGHNEPTETLAHVLKPDFASSALLPEEVHEPV